MWAVYLCGPTDCFLHCMFFDKEVAEEWAVSNNRNPEGYYIKYFNSPMDVDIADTGREQ